MAGATSAPKKATTNGKATKAAAEAALAELDDRPRASVFRGVALVLPPKLPATFALDMAAVQASEGQNNLGPIYKLLVGSLGAEQWDRVRDKIALDGDSMDDIGEILRELLEAITAPYNMESGESPASATS